MTSEILKKVIKQINDMGEHFYHTIYLDGKKYEGMRNPMDRINRINFIPELRSILDLGCNVGGMIWPYRFYSSWSVGVDRNKELVEFCGNLSKIYGTKKKMRFLNCDIDKSINDLNHLGKFDVIFLLAMTQHLKNWRGVIKWAHEHSDLLFIEYNGQPSQIEEYIGYTKTLRKIDHLMDIHGRHMYVCYNPVRFEFGGRVYNTYKYNTGGNVEAYLSTKDNAVIKICKNKSYETELEWCKKLDCAPDVLHVDRDRDVIIQEFVGPHLTYYNMPDNHELQINNIVGELAGKDCNGEDVELHVKDGKIKLVDLSACKKGELKPTIGNNLGYCLSRRKAYVNGGIL